MVEVGKVSNYGVILCESESKAQASKWPVEEAANQRKRYSNYESQIENWNTKKVSNKKVEPV